MLDFYNNKILEVFFLKKKPHKKNLLACYIKPRKYLSCNEIMSKILVHLFLFSKKIFTIISLRLKKVKVF